MADFQSRKPRLDAPYAVGVDLGGQNVRAAVMRRGDREPKTVSLPSDAKEGADRVRARVVEVVQKAMGSAGVTLDQVAGVGVAVAGHIDPVTGVIHWSPNFGHMEGSTFKMFLEEPFTEPVGAALGLPVYAANDANAAVLGEWKHIGKANVTDIVMFTLGTGIGGGVVSGGRLLTGSTGGAVEIGHHVIVAGGRKCGCGTLGCLEAYCGTDAILERALRMMERNLESSLWHRIEEDKTNFKPIIISEEAIKGDATAQAVWEETGYYLGIGMGNAVNLFNPQYVILGGQIRNATGLLAAAERSMRRHLVYSIGRTCSVIPAELGDHAGVVGGAELVWEAVDAARS
ncbi:MAG: ROK family protein [Chthonomonadales bacterium]|nr:ROK family protein [Chthonomonadales bacterium]